MTYDELEQAIREILPGASLDNDLNGQLIVYTDLMENPTHNQDAPLVQYEEVD